MWLAALIWAAVPYVLAGVRPGACVFVQSIGPASVIGEIMAQDASEMISPRWPKVPSPKRVVCLKKLSGGVDCLVIRLALYCWKYRVRKACHDVLDGGVLHIGVLVGPGCLLALLIQKRFWTGVPKKT
jgi:hypothetical protein